MCGWCTDPYGGRSAARRKAGDLSKPRLRESLGGGLRGDPLRVGSRVDLCEGVADPGEPRVGRLAIPAERLDADRIERAACVDDEVGRVDDPGPAQALRVIGLAQLIVRIAGDNT